MQQIERVGVVALLFLIVTIVVVAFWDDGQRAESTRVADRDARREEPSAEARVRADERGLRDDGRVAARPDRDRLTAPVGGGDDHIPQPRDVSAADRADRIARSAEARRARRQEREREDVGRGGAAANGGPAGGGPVALELPRGRSLAEEERMLRRGYANAPVDTGPAARIPDPASRKQKPRTAPVETTSGTWVVKSGETLERIARRALGEGKRWPEIASLNGIENPGKIFVGQKLQLPGGAGATPDASGPGRAETPPAAPEVAASTEVGPEYVVKKGDMLSIISQRQLGSAKRWKEIVALNPKVDPDRLLVGTRLRMPVGAAAPAAPARSARSRRVAQADGSGFRVR